MKNQLVLLWRFLSLILGLLAALEALIFISFLQLANLLVSLLSFGKYYIMR